MMRRIIAALALVLAGCAPTPRIQPPATPLPARTLTPFLTFTPRPSPTATDPATPTPLPSPTPTPRTHTVARGEDLGGISYRYKIRLEDLLAANPKVQPNAMSVGTVLIIPGAAPAATDLPPTPAPQGVELGRVECSPTREGGAWCFVPVHNGNEQAVENVSAVVRLANPDTGKVDSRVANALLNRLPAGASTALAVHFPAPAPPPYRASAELLTALPLPAASGRYLEAGLEDLQVAVAADGLSAAITANLRLESGVPARQIWVVAVAYRADGQVAAVRRWESAQPLEPEQSLPVAFTIYSAGGAIQRVEALVEARP